MSFTTIDLDAISAMTEGNSSHASNHIVNTEIDQPAKTDDAWRVAQVSTNLISLWSQFEFGAQHTGVRIYDFGCILRTRIN